MQPPRKREQAPYHKQSLPCTVAQGYSCSTMECTVYLQCERFHALAIQNHVTDLPCKKRWAEVGLLDSCVMLGSPAAALPLPEGVRLKHAYAEGPCSFARLRALLPADKLHMLA